MSKKKLGKSACDKLLESLTVSKRVVFASDEEVVEFCACMETDKYLYVPKYFGVHKFGLPSVDKIMIQNGEPIHCEFTGTLFDNQKTALTTFLEAAEDPLRMGGILQLPPGFGKTVLALAASARLGVKTLVLVHKEFLIDQWAERAAMYIPGARIGRLKQNRIETTDRDIVLASVQSVSMRDYDNTVFDGFGLLIVDECHHMAAQVFSRALSKINVKYTMGLSATVDRKDGLTKVLKWFLGDVLVKISQKTEVPCVIRRILYNPKYKTNGYGREFYLQNGKLNIAKMINMITENNERTICLANIIRNVLISEPSRNIIVLSDRRQHLVEIKTLLCEYECGMYVGQMKPVDLEKSKNCKILLGTYTMVSEGFDLARLDTLVLASPKSDVEQSIGRIQRKHVIGPEDNIPMVLDVVDTYSVFTNQSDKRNKFYRKRKYSVEEKNIAD